MTRATSSSPIAYNRPVRPTLASHQQPHTTYLPTMSSYNNNEPNKTTGQYHSLKYALAFSRCPSRS